MPRITPLTNPTGQAAELLDTLRGAIGKDLNIFTTMAHSPAALKSYMDVSGNLKAGTLDAKLLESIALTCAGFNGCGYCASAHTAIGKGAGLSDENLASALESGTCDCDGNGQAALTFTKALLKNRGQVSDADFAAVKDAGFSEAQIIEIVAAVGLNIFTNYFNDVAQTAIDFPEVKATRCCDDKKEDACCSTDKADDACCAA